MSDLIKRNDAIDTVRMYHFYALNADEREQAILDIPSADSTECVCCEYRVGDACCYSDVDKDRPQGEWKNYKDEHRCSACGEVVIGDWYCDDEWYSYCPNCGADMRGDKDDY